MDFRQLRYFVAVAEQRNFHRAAERLHIAQPPLSRTIQQLEAEIGAELLDRTARPLQLTPAGHLLHTQALQLLGRMEDLRAMMRAAVASEKRLFTIGFVASTIYARLPELIRAFRSAAPEVELILVESSTIDQIAALKEGRIDVGFGRIRFEDPAVRRIILRYEPLVAAIAADRPLAQQEGPVTLAALAAEPLIIYPRQPRPSYADQVISLFHDHGLEPRVIHEARELQIAIGLVAASEGLAIVPQSVRQARSEGIVYRDIVELAVSPIIMSKRVGDNSDELAIMQNLICERYADWGYEVPAFPNAD